MAETTIRDFHNDDVWRDDQGAIWVRLEELVTAVSSERDRADRAEARLAQILEYADSTYSVSTVARWIVKMGEAAV